MAPELAEAGVSIGNPLKDKGFLSNLRELGPPRRIATVAQVVGKLLPAMRPHKDGRLEKLDGTPFTTTESTLLYIKATHGDELLDNLGKPGKAVIAAYQIDHFIEKFLAQARQYAIDLVPMLDHYLTIARRLLTEVITDKLARLSPTQRDIIRNAEWFIDPAGKLFSVAIRGIEQMRQTPTIAPKPALKAAQ